MIKEQLTSKTLFWGLINGVLAVAVLLGLRVLLFRTPFIVPQETITISADGKAVVTPDLGTISFSVVTEGKDPKTIQTDNTKKMNAALDFIKAQGVDQKDIKTANYNLYPRYDYIKTTDIFGGKQVLAGYTITQTVQVKVRVLDKIATILGGLPDKGINQIESVSFSVEDPEKYLNDARKEAFDKARAKADAMASQNGLRIVRVVTFSESESGWPGPIPYYAEKLGVGGATSADAGAPPRIEPGSQDVAVQVTAVYEIR